MPAAKASIVGSNEALMELNRDEISSEEADVDANASSMQVSEDETRVGLTGAGATFVITGSGR